MRDCFEKLLSDYEQIAHNQIGPLEPNLSKDEVISAYKETTETLWALRRNTGKIFEEHLYPFLSDVETITDDDEAELYAVAQKLSSYEVRHDPAIALKIYEALLAWARFRKDDPKTIRYSYWCGITLFLFLVKKRDRILEYFKNGSSFADRYHTFPDPETRQYIHRCLGNASMIQYNVDKENGIYGRAMAMEDSNYAFWNSIIFSGKDLEFPWLNYFILCLNHRHSHLSANIKREPDSATKEELQKVLDNAITINKLYQKNRSSFSAFGGSRYDYILWEAQFLSGLISFDHLRENIYKRKTEFEADDFSSDALFVKITLSTHLMFYASKMEKLKGRKNEILAAESAEAIRHFSIIPKTVSPVTVGELLQPFTTDLSEIFEPEEQLDFILRMSTYRHIPTYAHSIIVGRIAAVLTRHLAETEPGLFVGCLDIANEDEVKGRIEELCSFAIWAGLCHDIGKVSYSSNPYMQARVLTEEEFEKTKQHPEAGANMLKREADSTLHRGYIDVIWGHHKHYDNKGGFPEDFDIDSSKYRIMIHIISIADTIDEATEDIGDTCMEAKSLEAACLDIKAEAGTRYSPVVANALFNESVQNDINKILDVGRKDAYYTAYRHAWDGRDQE